MPNDPESLGTGIGPLLADLIPLMPSGARRAGAARVMAARVGRDPSVLIDQPRVTQLLALGLGAVGGAYTQGQSKPVRLAAIAGPLALVQILRRLELGSIQKSYDTQKRKRLRELDEAALLDSPGWFGTNGSTRLGAVSAYETMRDRKYKGYSSLAEAGDAMHLAAGGLHPGLALPMSALVSVMDNREAQGMRDLSKKAEFTDQRNMPAIPLYLAAALASSAGLAGARHVAIHEGRDTEPLGTKNWPGMISRVSGTEPMMLATQGSDNAFFYKPRDEREALRFLRNYAAGLQNVTPTTGSPQRGEYGQQMDRVQRLMRAGVIVADEKAGAPTIAHEAGHAKIEETPGFLRALQRHVYPHQSWIAPLAGAGSMAAGLASGSALKGGLLGTGIGLLAGMGQVGPEAGASYHGLKGLGGGAMGTEGKKDLAAALATYLAFGVLPSTLSGAAGGWISGRRKKKSELASEPIEKAAAWDPRKMWQVLNRIQSQKMSGYLADEYVKGIFGVHYKPLKIGFSKLPLDVQQAAKLPLPPAPPKSIAPAPADPQQGLLDLFKQGAHPALPMLLEAKRHSDAKRYDIKNRYLRQNMRRDPDSWIVDSDDGKGIVGVTHIPTGFRLHMLKSVVDPDVLKYHTAIP